MYWQLRRKSSELLLGRQALANIEHASQDDVHVFSLFAFFYKQRTWLYYFELESVINDLPLHLIYAKITAHCIAENSFKAASLILYIMLHTWIKEIPDEVATKLKDDSLVAYSLELCDTLVDKCLV